jgi:hypothetical protein
LGRGALEIAAAPRLEWLLGLTPGGRDAANRAKFQALEMHRRCEWSIYGVRPINWCERERGEATRRLRDAK